MADRAMLTLARLRRAERTRARSAAQTRSEAEDGKVRLFCFAMQRRWLPWNLRDNPPVENSRGAAIAGPGRSPPDRTLEGRGRASTQQCGPRLTGHDDIDFEGLRLSCVTSHRKQEANDVMGHEPAPQDCSEVANAEGLQILVKVAKPG
jgi:hypothetical protein